MRLLDERIFLSALRGDSSTTEMTVKCSKVPYRIRHYSILYCTILYYTTLYHTILYYTVPYYTILHCTILYCTTLYHTMLYYTVPYYTVLFYTGDFISPCTALSYLSKSDITLFRSRCRARQLRTQGGEHLPGLQSRSIDLRGYHRLGGKGDGRKKYDC
jgi:hypothetical protein